MSCGEFCLTHDFSEERLNTIEKEGRWHEPMVLIFPHTYQSLFIFYILIMK